MIIIGFVLLGSEHLLSRPSKMKQASERNAWITARLALGHTLSSVAPSDGTILWQGARYLNK